MKEALAFIGVLALAAALWFLKGHSDKKIFDSKDETIKSLQDAVQSKEEIVVKNNALIDSSNATAKSLRDMVQAKEDIIAKNNALIDSNNETIKSLKEIIQTKDDIITKDSTMISVYQDQLAELNKKSAPDQGEDKDGQNVYPEDNGFEAQDMGSGFFSYKYFGKSVRNPNNVPLPPSISNRTPWTFSGNAGVAANNCGFYVHNATNLDGDGTTSTNGQAGFLQFKGSSISQSVTLPAGTYTVTFDYEARRDYAANKITASIDGTELFKGTPTDCTNFVRVVTSPIDLTTSGKHLLAFCGLGGKGDVDGDTFIDNISINLVHLRSHEPDLGNVNLDGMNGSPKRDRIPPMPPLKTVE